MNLVFTTDRTKTGVYVCAVVDMDRDIPVTLALGKSTESPEKARKQAERKAKALRG